MLIINVLHSSPDNHLEQNYELKWDHQNGTEPEVYIQILETYATLALVKELTWTGPLKRDLLAPGVAVHNPAFPTSIPGS